MKFRRKINRKLSIGVNDKTSRVDCSPARLIIRKENMRVNIKTKGRVKDKDIKALYLMNHALNISSAKMRIENLKFIVGKLGYNLIKSS
jgi:hypothetical protein